MRPSTNPREVVRGAAPARDGEYRLLTPANTVYDLVPRFEVQRSALRDPNDPRGEGRVRPLRLQRLDTRIEPIPPGTPLGNVDDPDGPMHVSPADLVNRYWHPDDVSPVTPESVPPVVPDARTGQPGTPAGANGEGGDEAIDRRGSGGDTSDP